MDSNVLDREQVWKQRTEDSLSSSQRLRIYLIGVGVLATAAMAVAFIIGFLGGQQSVPQLERQNHTLTGKVAGLTQEITQLRQGHYVCATFSSDIRLIYQLIGQGKYATAAAIADTDLRTSKRPICGGSALPQLWLQASMDDLYSQPPTSPLDRSAVVEYETITRRARRLGLTGDSPLQVAHFAYNTHRWLLCQAAFVEALREQLVSLDDVGQLELYAATLRNLGHQVAFGGYQGQDRAQALEYLATSREIARRVGLGGEAGQDLLRLLGPERATKVQPNWQDPVLAALVRS